MTSKSKRRTARAAAAIALALMGASLVGCSQASRVSHNISKEADQFNVTRQLVAVNTRTDKVLFEVVGNFSIANNASDELEIIMEVGPNRYKKHYLYINRTWTAYTVEDISGADVSPYHYEINILPEMIQPFSITNSD